MSKHVWRGAKDDFGSINVMVPPPYECTVVEDAACFPVKEAMRFIREMHRLHYTAPIENEGIARCMAVARYETAVARMKARKGERK